MGTGERGVHWLPWNFRAGAPLRPAEVGLFVAGSLWCSSKLFTLGRRLLFPGHWTHWKDTQLMSHFNHCNDMHMRMVSKYGSGNEVATALRGPLIIIVA